MIYLELSDSEIVYSTEFQVADAHDIAFAFEEILRLYLDDDLELDNYIVKRGKEIQIKCQN